MAFDPVWEGIHNTREWGRYPDTHFVRWVARRYYGVRWRSAIRFLDLGCGAGANSWFLTREGFEAVALDGSISAVCRAGNGVVADAVHLPFKEATFDCVVDIACITHNSEGQAHAIINEASRVLKQGGQIFSVMPTTYCWREPYAGKGAVIFARRDTIHDLFDKHFAVEINRSWFSDGKHAVDHWLISGTKHATTRRV